MYRLQNPTGHGKLPMSAPITSFPSFDYSKPQAPQVHPTQTVPVPSTPQPSASQFESMKTEFENLIREKLSKVDEVLLALKDKSEKISEPVHKKVEENGLKLDSHKVKMSEKKKKRSFFPITDNMWFEIKQKFTDLPDTYRNSALSDGVDYYVNYKNKKVLLDGKGYLKILNNL